MTTQTAWLQFQVLGPLEVTGSGRPLNVGGPQLRAVLARLLIDVGRVVSVSALVDELWGTHPPDDAVRTARTYVSRLRTALRAAARACDAQRADAEELLVTHPMGYQLRIDPGTIDAIRFERAVVSARGALRAGQWQRAYEQLGTALGLWRGDAFADFDGLPALTTEGVRLGRLRLDAVEDRMEAALAIGLGDQLVGEIQELVEAHPERERLWGHLMVALYRTGRQTEALAAFRSARTVLIDEHGVEPSPALTEIHRRILNHDPELTAEIDRQPVAERPAAPPVPAQLPPAVSRFVGRRAELRWLHARLTTRPGAEPDPAGTTPQDADLVDPDTAGDDATPTIVVISGTAGVGKTSLAVRWAHQIADQFPDGQLYVNLRGYDPEQPVPAVDALAGFLRAFGVSGQDIPIELDERAARYRTALTGRRVLAVLDNAGSVEQVRSLLPGNTGCLAVVTSRDALTGLVARDGARRLDLDRLPSDDARALLHRLIGPRVTAEASAANELADQCARLPLALRVAAELAAAHPDTSLAGLTRELADQRRRLELLDAGGEIRTAVRSVFSWSYRQLPGEAARAFRMLGLHPGQDFDGYAVAAMTGLAVEHAERLCALLARAHLVHRNGFGRYGMHDLLRAYATYLAETEDGEPERRSALSGLFDYYLAAAAAAMDTLHPAERHKRPRVEPIGSGMPVLRYPGPARAWLDRERPNLVLTCAYTAGHGWTGHTTRLAQTLFRFFDIAGHHAEALAVHTHAHHAARACGDRSAEARALNNLAAVFWWQARYPRAVSHYQEAVELFRVGGDRAGEADALTNLGMVHRSTGELAPAAEYYRQALAVNREIGNTVGVAQGLTGLGIVYAMLGDLPRAAEHHEQALVLFREVGKTDGEADALGNLGDVYLQLGELARAAEHHEQALARYRQHGYRGAEANTLNRLGLVLRRQNDLVQAADFHAQALALHRHGGTRTGEAAALNGLGGTMRAAGSMDEARSYHTEALALATEIGNRYEQARAHDGLGAADEAVGEAGKARAHWEHALRIFIDLGTADADAVRANLHRLADPHGVTEQTGTDGSLCRAAP